MKAEISKNNSCHSLPKQKNKPHRFYFLTYNNFISGLPNYGKSWKNCSIGASDANYENFQTGSTFCRATIPYLYPESSLQRAWVAHAAGTYTFGVLKKMRNSSINVTSLILKSPFFEIYKLWLFGCNV